MQDESLSEDLREELQRPRDDIEKVEEVAQSPRPAPDVHDDPVAFRFS